MRGGPPPDQPPGGRPGQPGRRPTRFGVPPAQPPGPIGRTYGAPPGGTYGPPRPYGPREPGSAGRTFAPQPGQLGAMSGAHPTLGPGVAGPTYGPAGISGAWGPGAAAPDADHTHHHLGFAVFHDGNPGHLWRGEFGSMLGEAVTAAGLVMWLAYLTYSPKDVALGLIALGLPFVIAGPVAATLTRVEEPAGLFKLVGRLRVAFALALIGLHFHTILPLLYLLLFGISLCGRLRAALRIAAMRACLAPGEPERVAASTHFAAVVVAVMGPLLAALLYILNGERILLVAIGAAAIFLLGTSADALVESIPPARRAFLLAQPATDLDEGDQPYLDDADQFDDDNDADATPASGLERREARLPEWEQWGPGTITEAVADITSGLTLAGSNGTSVNALRALAALALVGGGLGVLEVFYVTDHLLMPTFYLGGLLAAEGAGLALGATLWSDLGRRAAGKIALVAGMTGTGLALAVLAVVNQVPLAMGAAVALGAANAMAVAGAREALRAKFDGLERRALAATEGVVMALCALFGAGLFVLFHAGLSVPRPGSKAPGTRLTLLAAFSPAEILFAAGAGLALAGVALAVLLPLAAVTDRLGASRRAARSARASKRRTSSEQSDLELDDEDYEYDDAQEDLGASRSYAAAGGGWADDDDDDYGPGDRWEDSRYSRSYGAESHVGWDDPDIDDDSEDLPGMRGRGWPGSRTPPTLGGRDRRR